MMRKIRNATVITAKCRMEKRTFGMRMEQREDGVWYYNWAFPISEKAAKVEGYGETMVSGKVLEGSEYPGCPYCGSREWISCGSCGQVFCAGGLTNEDTLTKCIWCGKDLRIVISNEFKIKGSGF